MDTESDWAAKHERARALHLTYHGTVPCTHGDRCTNDLDAIGSAIGRSVDRAISDIHGDAFAASDPIAVAIDDLYTAWY